MKKFYLILCGLALAAGAQARSLTFSLGSEKIAPNSTVEFRNITVEELEPGGPKLVEMKPEIFLTSDIFTSSVEVTAACTNSHQIQLCAGGQCEKGVSVTKKNVQLKTNVPLNIQFDYNEELGPDVEVPEVVTDITAVDTKYPDTKISFTIVMNPKSGLTLIENGSLLRATSAGLEYNLGNAAATLALYDLTGSRLINSRIEGTGTLSHTRLRPGIYVYSIQGKGIKSTGKIYIR